MSTIYQRSTSTHHAWSDAAIRARVQNALDHYAGTRQFHVAVEVMDRRVFLHGRLPWRSDVRVVQRTASRARDVAEVIDLLEVTDVRR